MCGPDCVCAPFVCKNGHCNKNYLVFLTAKWCRPCARMYPQIEKLRQAGYIVYVIDVDQYTKTRDHFEVKSVPTFVIMDKRKEVARFTGVTDVAKLTEHLVKEDDQKDDPKPQPTPSPDKYNFIP